MYKIGSIVLLFSLGCSDGMIGPKGDKGDQGPQGQKGDQGATVYVDAGDPFQLISETNCSVQDYNWFYDTNPPQLMIIQYRLQLMRDGQFFASAVVIDPNQVFSGNSGEVFFGVQSDNYSTGKVFALNYESTNADIQSIVELNRTTGVLHFQIDTGKGIPANYTGSWDYYYQGTCVVSTYDQ